MDTIKQFEMRAKIKHKLNIIIDTVAFIEFVFIATTGFLVKYTLPAGSGHYATIWGLDRHQWGDLHFWVCIGFLGTLLLHLVLHWKWISARLRGRKTDASGVRFGLGVFGFVMLILVGLIPVFSNVEYESRPGRDRRVQQLERQQLEKQQPERRQESPGRGKNRRIQVVEADEQDMPEQTDVVAETEKEIADESIIEEDYLEMPDETLQDQPEVPHEVSSAEVDVRGYMTLKEVSETFNVPADHILKELGITDRVNERETFGRLRRSYGFEMHEVRDIILKYQKE